MRMKLILVCSEAVRCMQVLYAFNAFLVEGLRIRRCVEIQIT